MRGSRGLAGKGWVQCEGWILYAGLLHLQSWVPYNLHLNRVVRLLPISDEKTPGD